MGLALMNDVRSFVDYYTILQVHPECDARTLESAYRNLARSYHSDHPETAEIDMFNAVIEAYRALKDHDKRLAYDAQYSSQTGFVFAVDGEILTDERTAQPDADVHAQVLLCTYEQRRDRAQEPGVGQFELQHMLGCTNETSDFKRGI